MVRSFGYMGALAGKTYLSFMRPGPAEQSESPTGIVRTARMNEPPDSLDRFTLQAERDFRASVGPVYRNSVANPRPEHIGSCVLLNMDGVPTVVTAAHILDQRADQTLYVAGVPGTSPVPILRGVVMTTPTLEARRVSDHFDTAIWQPLTVDALGAVDFLDAWRISHNRPQSADRLYTALGYAISRNKKAVDHRTRSISTHVSMYTGDAEEMPELASKLRVTASDHLFSALRTTRLYG